MTVDGQTKDRLAHTCPVHTYTHTYGTITRGDTLYRFPRVDVKLGRANCSLFRPPNTSMGLVSVTIETLTIGAVLEATQTFAIPYNQAKAKRI